MKKTYIIISLFTVIIFVVILYKQSTSNYSPKTKLLQTDEKYNRGKQVYEKNCVSCHDKKMTEYATAPPLG